MLCAHGNPDQPWGGVGFARFFFVPMTGLSKSRQLEKLVEESLAASEFEVVEICLKKAGQESVLFVTVDHENGVTLDHCGEVSRLLLDVIEENDPIEYEYRIEVSSPGVDRPLAKPADFSRFAGERVFVKFHRALEGHKTLTGTLGSLEPDVFVVANEEDERDYRFTLKDVARATLKPILNFS